MALDKATLDAYIQALYDDDGQLSSADYQLIINYILSNGNPETDPRDLFQVRRGDEVDLPALAQGEPALTLDTERFYMGGLSGNIRFPNIKDMPFVNLIQYNPKGDGVTDDYTVIQQAINDAAGGILYWNKQKGAEYLVADTISIPENTSILFETGVIVKSTAASVAFRINEVDNVNILGNGSLFIKPKSLYPTGEWAHTFSIGSAHNVLIDNVQIFENGGDGVYIGGQSTDLKECRNIVIRNCKIDGSKRNNISITYAENVTIDSCLLVNASGTNPQFGIDIEPNAGTFARYINVVNCHAEGNVQAGFGLAFGAEHCSFRGCSAKNTGLGFTFDANVGLENNFNTISDCVSEDNTSLGFYIRYSPNTQIQNCKSLNNGAFGLQFTESPNSIASNNIIDGNGNRGVVMASNGLRFVNNKVSNNTEGGIVATAGKDCIISGNYCIGNYGATYNSNMHINLDNSIFSNNTCRKGTNASQPTQGINIAAGADNCLVVNNDLFDSGTISSIYNASLTTVDKGNINLSGVYSQNILDYPDVASATWDPISVGAGLTVTGVFGFNGARIGDFVQVSPPYAMQGLTAFAYINNSNSVTLTVSNNTGAAVDLASGTWKFKLMKN